MTNPSNDFPRRAGEDAPVRLTGDKAILTPEDLQVADLAGTEPVIDEEKNIMLSPEGRKSREYRAPVSESRRQARRRQKRRWRKISLSVLCSFLALLLVLTGGFFISSELGRRSLLGDTPSVQPPKDLGEEVIDDGRVLTYQGQRYVYNENIVSVLCMGMDENRLSDGSGYGKNGQADAIFLACLDTKTGSVKVLPISRETMVEINETTVQGQEGDIVTEQICLAYAYGNDAISGSKNMALSVQRLLYGIAPDATVVMDQDGIGKLSGLLGGVQVTCDEDLSGSGAVYKKGKSYVLKGKALRNYIQLRGGDLAGNQRRMEREKAVLRALVSATAKKVSDNPASLLTLYNKMSPYFSTSLTFNEITYLSSRCLTTDLGSNFEYLSIKGELREGKETLYAEFYPDEASVYEAVLSLFYTPIK